MEIIDFEETFDDYKRRIFDLNTMLEIGKTLNASLSLKDVLDIIVLTCNGHFHSSDAIILLATNGMDQPYFEYKSSSENICIDSSDPFVKYINENQRVILLDELKENQKIHRAYNIFTENGINLIMPLRFKSRVNGILCLKKKEEEFGSAYTDDEKEYVAILAGFASVAIENARLYEIATLDIKTKLFNHGYFQNQLVEEIERAERYKTDLSLMMLDLDNFKKVNDTYGHVTGDDVLIEVAQSIKNQVRTCDIPARFGGEEFAIILPETDTSSSLIVAERLRKSIENLSFNVLDAHSDSDEHFSITISIGITSFVHSVNMTEDILIERADKALYHAKQNGRNLVVLFENIENAMDP